MENSTEYGILMPASNERNLTVVTDDPTQKENIHQYFEEEFDKAGILTYKVEVHVY